MHRTLRIALAQINSTVGDLQGNTRKIITAIQKARQLRADIVAFPELAVTGYPPEDLVLKPQFIEDNIASVQKISRKTTGITAVVGFVDRDAGLCNAAAVMAGGRIRDIYHKIKLPNYGVFDEVRYFRPGKRCPVYSVRGVAVGITICEDIWHQDGPVRTMAEAGAEVIININASPFEMGKPLVRERILAERSRGNNVVIAYLNAVGGQDELVFDGLSMVYDRTGSIVSRGRQFEDDFLVFDVDRAPKRAAKKISVAGRRHMRLLPAMRTARKAGGIPALEPRYAPLEETYGALVLGTADYVRKNGFSGVVVGLSGGVDSSLVATIACDAIGRDRVTGVFMPSEYTSKESREDAAGLARNLGIVFRQLPISGVMKSYFKVLAPHFQGREPDTTEENLQARIRGNLLMALSNKFGWLVLTTGNKSEMSVGYATLYGDMAGGFAVIKDVPKTLVYELCRWRNAKAGRCIIPDRVLWKEPTAELRPGQKDTDSLPPYDVLDPLLKAYIEDELSFSQILGLGSTRLQTERVIRMVDRSEYKRRQSPPGIKITSRAFGRDWRFPITNKYRSY